MPTPSLNHHSGRKTQSERGATSSHGSSHRVNKPVVTRIASKLGTDSDARLPTSKTPSIRPDRFGWRNKIPSSTRPAVGRAGTPAPGALAHKSHQVILVLALINGSNC